MRQVSKQSRSRSTRPRALPRTKEYKEGMAWRVIDAAAASINDGPNCFQNDFGVHDASLIGRNFSSVDWSRELSPLSPASRLSRRLRIRMNTPYYVREGRSILAVGILFRFLHVQPGGKKNERRYCVLGSSILGERTTEASLNYLAGKRGVDMPPGDWNDVLIGVFILFFLSVATSTASRWMSVLAERRVLPHFLRYAAEKSRFFTEGSRKGV